MNAIVTELRPRRGEKLRRRAAAPHDGYMTKRYLSLSQFAERVNMTPGALNSYGAKLPKPDVIVGDGQQRPIRGWSEKTIDTWNASRRGSGNWGSKK